VSELEEQFLKARRVAVNVVVGQLGLTLLISTAALLFAGSKAGISALMGGSIGTLSSLYMVTTLFRRGADVEPAKILGRVYRGEFYKLAITAGLFGLVLVSMEVSFGPMLGCFAATLMVYWPALVLQSSDLTPHKVVQKQVTKG